MSDDTTTPPLADKQRKERAWVHARMTRSKFADFIKLCYWLKEQPYHASYTMKFWSQRRDYEIARLRRYCRVVFWSTGHGWRLRKNWRERLQELALEFGYGPVETPEAP